MHFPEWVQASRLLLTFLATSAAGVYAYILYAESAANNESYNSLAVRVDNPLRLAFLFYSILFLFTSVVNFAYLLITVALRSYGAAPLKAGMLSMLLIVSFFIVVFSRGQRAWGGR